MLRDKKMGYGIENHSLCKAPLGSLCSSAYSEYRLHYGHSLNLSGTQILVICDDHTHAESKLRTT